MLNGFVHVALLLLGGLIGAANFIIKKNPNAKETIAKLSPAKGGIGIAMLVLGLFSLIRFLPYIGFFFKLVPMTALILLVALVVEIVLGALLGYELIAKYTIKGNEEAEAKGEAIREKLAKYQTPLGIVSILVAVILLIMNFAGPMGM